MTAPGKQEPPSSPAAASEEQEPTQRAMCFGCPVECQKQRLLAGIRNHFRATWHNIVGHPVSELLWICGLKRTSWWFHNITSPRWIRLKRKGIIAVTGANAPR